MTYLSGKAQQQKKRIRQGIFFVVFLLVVFFWSTIHFRLYSVLEPVLIRYGSVKNALSLFPEFFSVNTSSNRLLVTKNKELELTIERLENELAAKNAYVKETVPTAAETARNGEKTELPQRELVLYPLMQDATKIYSSLILSKGFKEGVEVGEIVYVRGRQAVCRIQEVYTSTSRCVLLSASGVVTEAVTSSSSISIDLLGRGGSFLSNIARDTPIEVGEKVYLKSDQSMTLGTIIQIANNNQDTSWHLFVRGAYNPLTSSVFYLEK